MQALKRLHDAKLQHKQSHHVAIKLKYMLL